MKSLRNKPDKGDPSDVLQFFTGFSLNLLCCRFWYLKHWEFRELCFPYWRLYYNKNKGAKVIFNGCEYNLEPERIMLIPPNTSFSTRLFDNEIPRNNYVLEGGRLDESLNHSIFLQNNYIQHLFIHFNLGFPYDNVKPIIYNFDITHYHKDKLDNIINYLSTQHSHFDFYSVIGIHSLISDLIARIPKEDWNLASKDLRILNLINYIEDNLSENLSNEKLANELIMSDDSFRRLFKFEIGISPQQFIKKKRIDMACTLLHHSEKTIDEIAIETGLANRYYFSRIFKNVTGIPPSQYRKEFRMK